MDVTAVAASGGEGYAGVVPNTNLPGVFILSGDRAVRYKAQLYEGLETVADAEDQAVPVLDEIRQRFFQGHS